MNWRLKPAGRHDRFREMMARRAELSRGDDVELREHLRACPECRETAEAYARQTLLLRSLPLVDPPPALRAGVLASVAAAAPARRLWVWWPAALAAPAGLAVAAVLALVLLNGPHGGSRVAAPPTTIPATKAAPSPTPHPTARPSGVKGHTKHHHAGASATATLPAIANPGSGPAGTQVAVVRNTPVSASTPAAPRPTAPRSPVTGGHTGRRPTTEPTAAGGSRSNPPPPQPTVAPLPTTTPLQPAPPTPIRVAPAAPTPTAVVLTPPSPTTGVVVGVARQATATPGPSAPTNAPSPAPTP